MVKKFAWFYDTVNMCMYENVSLDHPKVSVSSVTIFKFVIIIFPKWIFDGNLFEVLV